MDLQGKGTVMSNMVDMDAVELNSFMTTLKDIDIIENYSFSLVKYSYIMVYSCLFPAGALLLLILNILEIRVFLYGLFNCFQRPLCQRVVSIGSFENYWNLISYASVFSNVLLLHNNGQRKRERRRNVY